MILDLNSQMIPNFSKPEMIVGSKDVCLSEDLFPRRISAWNKFLQSYFGCGQANPSNSIVIIIVKGKKYRI